MLCAEDPDNLVECERRGRLANHKQMLRAPTYES